ncbi:hypothetical protein HGRIS_012777 [Hohenbuehelia grisea]|uniref:Carrier domain-containing protein n=1 Tax=Hohenbuehelia grisea TaxID=104357 RepID=A0ABR3ITM6_9AGAR
MVLNIIAGTTGNPKGCLLTNAGLAQAVWALSEIAATANIDDYSQCRYLAIASIAFDVHLAETFVPIALRITLCSAPRSLLLECLAFFVRDFKITHIGLVPSLIEATINTIEEESGADKMPLRYIASGGEKISDSIIDKWANHHQVTLANFYGPSEVTIGCCARFMDKTTPKSNIGRTFPNVSGYVVDGAYNILPRGAVGELVVEGPLVGRGYHGRPELTQKVFMEWPTAGCKAYRTGDLVRMMPDSTFEILGRIDTQIKVRGVRIESEGISAVVRSAVTLTSRLSLDAITVLARHPTIGSDQIITFIAWDSTISISKRKSSNPHISTPPSCLLGDIRMKCEKELASYMRPSHIVPLSWIPLNSNGKADAKALVQFFNEIDLGVLTALTDTPKLGDDNCDTSRSLSGVERQAVGLAPLLTTRSSTPRDSYTAAFHRKWMPEIETAYPIDIVERILPAYNVQEGVLARSAESNLLYVQHVVVELRSRDSLTMVGPAWQKVVAHHPILRTVFHFSRELIQVILRRPAVSSSYTQKSVDFTDAPQFMKWFSASESPAISARLNDGVSTVPPIHCGAYASTNHVFVVISIHHALFDGTALYLILQDLEKAFLGAPLLQSPEPAEILDQIHDTDIDAAKDFWTRQFKGFAWPRSGLYAPSGSSARGIIVPFSTPLSVLKSWTAQQEVTLQALFTCAFAKLASTCIYHAEDLVFGVLRSGRLNPIDDIDSATCPLLSVLPFRVDLRGESPLALVQQAISEAIEFEHIPLKQVQGWLRPGLPLFDALFSISMKQHLDNSVWKLIQSQNPRPDYPLAVEVVLDPENDTLVVQAAWFEQALDGSMVQDLLRSFESISLKLAGQNDSVPSSPASDATLFDLSPEASSVTERRCSRQTTEFGRLRAVIADFLQVDADLLKDDTSFLSLGLDSIKSVGLSRLLRKEGVINVPPQTLITNPTMSKLVESCISERDNPDGDLARRLRTSIADFLQVGADLIKDDTSFISLGLDSIKAVGLSRRLRKEGIVEVPPQRLITDCTLAKLLGSAAGPQSPPAPALTTARTMSLRFAERENLRLSTDDHVTAYATTALQAGMLSHTIGSGGKLYVHSFPLLLRDGIDVVRLRNAWTEAVEHLKILRTSFYFAADRGVWTQIVHSVAQVNWSTDVYTNQADYERKSAAFSAALVLGDDTDFRTPPFRLRLYQPSSQGSVRLVLVIHHALYDGISLPKLFDIVQSIYGRQGPGHLVQFVDLLPQFAHQEQAGIGFWLEKLRGHRRVELPKKLTRGCRAWHGVERTVDVDSLTLASALKQSVVTAQCVAQAGLSKMLAWMTGSPDVVFGNVVSGRGMPGAEEVIGPVLNTNPCRVQFSDGMLNIDLLRHIHQFNVDSQLWQQASLRDVQKALGVERLWDLLLNYIWLEAEQDEQDAFWRFDTAEDEVKVQYPFNVVILQRREGFVVKMCSLSEYMDADELNSAIDYLVDAINDVITGADRPASLKAHRRIASSSHAAAEHQMPTIATDCSGNTDSIKAILATMTSLPVARITPEVSLTAIGIDSITAIQFVAHCRKQGLRILARDVVMSRTVGDLIKHFSPPQVAVRSGDVEQAGVLRQPKVLPQPGSSRPVRRQSSHINSAADKLKSVLARVTNVPAERITADATLPALGIDSITAIQLAAHCRKEQLPVLVSDVVKCRTVADLMIKVANVSPADNNTPMELVDIDIPVDEANMIRRDLGEEQIESITIASTSIKWLVGGWLRSGGARYQHAFAFRVAEHVDASRLRSAWSALVERHAILRSTFWHVGPGAEPRLVTFKPDATKLDWSEEQYPDHTFFRDTMSRLESMVDSPPGEGEGQTQAVIVSSSKHRYMLVHLHHLQYDAWSLQLLMGDLMRFYDGQVPLSSNDLAGYLRAYAPRPSHLIEQEKYWRSAFPSGFKPTLFPRLIPTRAGMKTSQRRRTTFTELNALQDASWCEERARALGVSLQTIFLACWAKLQSQYAPSPDGSVTFGVWHSGRGGEMEGIERLAVPCVNVLPVHVREVGLWSTEEVARRMQTDLSGRSDVVEQTEMGRIEEWVATKQRVCNVLINYIKVGVEVDGQHDRGQLLEPVHTPGYRPSSAEDPRYGVVQDDVVIDVTTLQGSDSVLVSVDASASIMDAEQSQKLLLRLITLVKGTLGLA